MKIDSLRNPTQIDQWLHDWLHAERLSERPRFADHSRETVHSVLDTRKRIAREKFAPFKRVADSEPWFDAERWLDVALCAQAASTAAKAGGAAHDAPTPDALNGKLTAARYFFCYELPKVPSGLKVVGSRDDTCRALQDSWF